MRIELRNISKSFNHKTVLQNICFDDEITSIAIIGPSGGGKSTLLRILGGLLPPDSGEMLINGNILDFHERTLRLYRRNIGFVFQANGLFEHLSAMENVMLPLIHTFGIGKDEARRTATMLFNRFGLAKHMHKHPFQLSGGQQQRISIARSVAIKPALLLLDEPTSALDPEYTSEVLDMLGELQAEGLRTIIVTHEMGFAHHACKKILFLSDTEILEEGDSSAIFTSPQTPQLRNFLAKVLEWKV